MTTNDLLGSGAGSSNEWEESGKPVAHPFCHGVAHMLKANSSVVFTSGRILAIIWVAMTLGCAQPPVRSTITRPPGPSRPALSADLAELWVEPEPDRDLFTGSARLAPNPSATYSVIQDQKGGIQRRVHGGVMRGPRRSPQSQSAPTDPRASRRARENSHGGLGCSPLNARRRSARSRALSRLDPSPRRGPA